MQKFKNELMLKEREHQLKMEQMQKQHELELQKHQLEIAKHEHEKRVARLEADPQGLAHQELVEGSMRPTIEALTNAMAQMAAAHSAPIQIHRDPATGRAIGASRRTN